MTEDSLPIDRHIPKILATLAESRCLILKADPGTGKTTRLPPALLPLGKTIVLEPRRLAARLSANFVAKSLGEPCGERVGYQVRFDQRLSKQTRLRYMTEGLFIRQLERDPQLSDTQYIILDEFHERHLDTDLALAFIRHLQTTSRPDLKLVIMSATVNLDQLENYLPEAQVFNIEGRVFPVETHYRPLPDYKRVEDKVYQGISEMIQQKEYPGDILVFLSGFKQIRACQNLLSKKLSPKDFEVLPLAADIPPKQQALVFNKSSRRKIILSTNVAETSVTLPYITGVIDTGFAKEASFAPWSGLPMLQEKRVSRASCIQRTGRAGRTQKGICYRLFDQSDFLKRDEFTRNEILRTDLSQLILFLKAHLGGVPEISTCLDWLTIPPAGHIKACQELLQNLGALDKLGHLTGKGSVLAKWPLHPRLGAILYESQRRNVVEHGLIAISLLSEDMILDSSTRAFAQEPCDVTYQGNLLLKIIRQQDLDSVALERAIDRKRLTRVTSLYQQLRQNVSAKALADVPKFNASTMMELLIEGFPDRVARHRPAAKSKRQQERSFHFCLGRGGILSDYSTVRKADYIVVLSAMETPGQRNAAIKTQISFASSIDPQLLFQRQTMIREELDVRYDEASESFNLHQGTYYGQLCLKESIREAEPSVVESLLRKKVLDEWPDSVQGGADLEIYHKKIDLMTASGIEHGFPRFEGEYLEFLIHEICHDKYSMAAIKEVNLNNIIRNQLSPKDLYLLDTMTPDKLSILGRSKGINYLGELAPSMSGRIQEFLGVGVTPSICGGRLPLNLVLLAPNNRPAQITQDLKGFWQGSYAQVRKELARRYPKHHWPENPMDLDTKTH